MKSIGIDVGAKGGIAIVDENGQLILLERIPDIKGKTDYNTLAGFFTQFKESFPNSTVFIEDVHSIFGSSAKSNFSFGSIKGFKMGLCAALRLRYELVQPKAWQKEVWNPSDKIYKSGAKKKTVDTKATSLLAAKRLFPDETFIATSRSKKPHDGLVDAALIAYYGFLRTNKR